MIIDEKGKLFGKISIIDIAVILIILVSIAGGAAVYGKVKKKELSPSDKAVIKHSEMAETVEAKLLVEGVRSMTLNAISAGDELYHVNANGDLFGKITDISYEPHKELISSESGDLKYTEYPERYDIYLTVDLEGMKNENGFFTKTNEHIACGQDVTVKTMYVKVTAKIKELSLKEPSGAKEVSKEQTEN